MRNTILLFMVIIAGVVPSPAEAQTDTTFTYQGELKQSGQPADGNFNFTFSLWGAASGGLKYGDDIEINSVPVENGRFAVQLDFGPNAFDSPDHIRWLEIEVQGQTLSPRQVLSPSPFAIQTKGIVVDENDNVIIGTKLLVSHDNNDAGIRVTTSEFNDGAKSVEGINYSDLGRGGFFESHGFGGEGVAGTGETGVKGETTIADGYSGHFSGPEGSQTFFQRDVGIGILDPLAKLHVATLSSSAGNNTAMFQASQIGPNASHIHFGTNGDWFIRSADNDGKVVLQDFSGGLVGIGVSNPDPAVKLHIGGQVQIDNLPSANATALHINNDNRLIKATSSRRYKENIEPLDLGEAAEAFLQLEPVSYNYIGSSDPDIGLIAEDVAELVPEMVTYNQDGLPEAVKYDKGVLYLLDIVRRQQAELAERDAVITQILERLERLENPQDPAFSNADAPALSFMQTVVGGAPDSP